MHQNQKPGVVNITPGPVALLNAKGNIPDTGPVLIR